MRIRISTFVLVSVLCPAAIRAQTPEERTRQALEQVLHRKYEAFYAQFTPEMKKAISLKDYASQGDQILASAGKLTGVDPARSCPVPNGVNVVIPIHWSDFSANFIVSWNRAGQVQGTWIADPTQPGCPNDSTRAAKPVYSQPAYSHPASFIAREVVVGDDEWRLPGTLLVPKGKGPFPALVLVHGSGPNDRDETVGGAKVFRDLAEGLASRGIAVLRYDKRTLAHPAECAKDPAFTMTRETVDDAIRAATLLRTQPGIDPKRIYVLGHSQGGYLIPRIMHADPALAGVIVFAGGARHFEDIIPEQIEYLFGLKGPLTETQRKQLDAVRRDPWIIMPGVPEPYKADLKDYNPVELAKSSPIPMLILQGERDYMSTMKDFALWKAGLADRPNVILQSFPALNHLFVSGEGKSTPQEYDKPAHVVPEVIDIIAAWTVHSRALLN
jgi:dienelactone hydrolase